MEMEKKTEKKKIIQVLECVSDGKQRHSRRRSWDSQGLGVIAVSSSLRAKVGLHGMLANLFLGFVPKMPPPSWNHRELATCLSYSCMSILTHMEIKASKDLGNLLGDNISFKLLRNAPRRAFSSHPISFAKIQKSMEKSDKPPLALLEVEHLMCCSIRARTFVTVKLCHSETLLGSHYMINQDKLLAQPVPIVMLD